MGRNNDFNNPYGVRTVREGIGSRIGNGLLKGGKIFAKGLGKLAFSIGKGLGYLAVGAGVGTAKASYEGAKVIGKLGVYDASLTAKSLTYKNPLLNPIGAFGSIIKKAADNIVEYKPSETVYNKTKDKLETRDAALNFTKKGKIMFAGITALSAINNAANASDPNNRNIDFQITKATPKYAPQNNQRRQIDFGGATGDLVFALHNNR